MNGIAQVMHEISYRARIIKNFPKKYRQEREDREGKGERERERDKKGEIMRKIKEKETREQRETQKERDRKREEGGRRRGRERGKRRRSRETSVHCKICKNLRSVKSVLQKYKYMNIKSTNKKEIEIARVKRIERKERRRNII